MDNKYDHKFWFLIFDKNLILIMKAKVYGDLMHLAKKEIYKLGIIILILLKFIFGKV